jgi:hypothetical protein
MPPVTITITYCSSGAAKVALAMLSYLTPRFLKTSNLLPPDDGLFCFRQYGIERYTQYTDDHHTPKTVGVSRRFLASSIIHPSPASTATSSAVTRQTQPMPKPILIPVNIVGKADGSITRQ